MKEIVALTAEFKEAVTRGYIPPIEMCRLIYEINASLMTHWPNIHDNLSYNLDDVFDDIWVCMEKFGANDE